MKRSRTPGHDAKQQVIGNHPLPHGRRPPFFLGQMPAGVCGRRRITTCLGRKTPNACMLHADPSVPACGSSRRENNNEGRKTRGKEKPVGERAGGAGPAQREGPALRDAVDARVGPGEGEVDRDDARLAGEHVPAADPQRGADGDGSHDERVRGGAAAGGDRPRGEGAALGHRDGDVDAGPDQRRDRRVQHRGGVRGEGEDARGGVRAVGGVPGVPCGVVRLPERRRRRGAVPQPPVARLLGEGARRARAEEDSDEISACVSHKCGNQNIND